MRRASVLALAASLSACATTAPVGLPPVSVTAVAETVLDRMLAAGGELVTLVLGDEAPGTIAEHLEDRVREAYLAVDTVVYRGGRQGALLLIGVE